MSQSDFKQGIFSYLKAEAIISATLCIPVILFIRSRPKIPPSISQSDYKSPPLWECMKLMMSNKNFITLLIMFTCIMGYLNIYGTIINSYFSKYRLTDDETSFIAGTANGVAITASIIVSIIIDKYKIYKKALLFLSLTGLVSHLLMTISIEVYEDKAWVFLLIFWTICSSTIVPIFTCSMDFVVEITYPVGESISGGFIMMVNQIVGIIGVRKYYKDLILILNFFIAFNM
jgi:Na+/melibiose symporter-like transporter